jgi:hypothetical protein
LRRKDALLAIALHTSKESNLEEAEGKPLSFFFSAQITLKLFTILEGRVDGDGARGCA